MAVSATKRVVVIGAGPAGLAAAEAAARAGRRVVVHDASASRAQVPACRTGRPQPHPFRAAHDLSRPLRRGRARLRPAIEAFPPEALRTWAGELGQATFVGSSGRVFPKSFKATPLLRAWLRRLDGLGVALRSRSRFVGFGEGGALRFVSPIGEETVEARRDGVRARRRVVAAARRGRRMGRGLSRAPASRSRRCGPRIAGFLVDWSTVFRDRFAGSPLKNVALSHGATRLRGEAIVTETGLEGGADLRACRPPCAKSIAATGDATLVLDLRPDVGRGRACRATRAQARPIDLDAPAQGRFPIRRRRAHARGRALAPGRRGPGATRETLRAPPHRRRADRARDLDRRRRRLERTGRRTSC